ncbi:unnamed protein product [Phaeothamnion confervicola]
MWPVRGSELGASCTVLVEIDYLLAFPVSHRLCARLLHRWFRESASPVRRCAGFQYLISFLFSSSFYFVYISCRDAVKRFDGFKLHGCNLRVEVSTHNKGPPGSRRDPGAAPRGGGGGGGRDWDADRGRAREVGRGGQRGNDKYRVNVFGLSRDCRWQDLKDLVRKYATPLYVDVMGGGEGVIAFESRDDMEYVVRKLDDRDFMAKTITLKVPPAWLGAVSAVLAAAAAI